MLHLKLAKRKETAPAPPPSVSQRDRIHRLPTQAYCEHRYAPAVTMNQDKTPNRSLPQSEVARHGFTAASPASPASPATLACSVCTDLQQNMVCALCKDVFRSPRFLSCHHCFCSGCVLGLVLSHGPTFPCPICRRETTLPPEGPDKLQVNFFFPEKILSEVRKSKRDNSCPKHHGCKLKFRCIECREAGCFKCTQHLHHKVQTITDARPVYRTELTQAEDRLKDKVKRLQEGIDVIHNKRWHVFRKQQGLLCQLRQQGEWLNSVVDKHLKLKRQALDSMCDDMDHQLAQDLYRVQRELASVRTAQHDVTDALTDDAPELLVSVAVQMDQSVYDLDGVSAALDSCGSVAPGLACSTPCCVEEVVSAFLGVPKPLALAGRRSSGPRRVPGSHPLCGDGEELLPVFHLGKHGSSSREILWVTPYLTEGRRSDESVAMILYRGEPPNCFAACGWIDAAEGSLYGVDMVEQQQQTGGGRFAVVPIRPLGAVIHNLVCPTFRWIHLSKSEPQVSLCRETSGQVGARAVRVVQKPGRPIEGNASEAGDYCAEAGGLLFEMDAVHPLRFDASPDGLFFALIERVDRDPESRRMQTGDKPAPSRRRRHPSQHLHLHPHQHQRVQEPPSDVADAAEHLPEHPSSSSLQQQQQQPPPRETDAVKLYVRGRRHAACTYQPAKRPFAPSDVCFWQEGGEQKLLISDWHHDDVHVVRVGSNGRLAFQRYLAEGHGALVKPSALNTDSQGSVWIGCSHGAVLICQTTKL